MLLLAVVAAVAKIQSLLPLSMSEENQGVLYPQLSQLLKMRQCLPAECNEVGDEVIIETKFHTVKGLLSYKDGVGGYKVSYNAVDAGFPDCYQLETCDVISIRCYNCCDDRYFELDSCDALTCDIISAALGAASPKLTGNIFLYSGDPLEPSCLWKWNGLNDIGQPENWIDQYGNFPAQFENLNDPQLCAFLEFLSAQFSGAGISFNVSQYCDSIIVTVGDGSDTAPATYTYSYSGGRISLDANDGSGRKDANVIVRGAGPPSEPYNWFFYINTNTGGVFINNNGDAELLAVIDLEGNQTCADIVACIAENIEAGAPDPDRWAMPQVTTGGSTWIIESVVYKPGESTLSANFATCSIGATTLDELVEALNGCGNNPSGWVWVNSGGVLTLCTPVGDSVLTVTYDVGSGSQVINFNGVPTVAGEDRADLCKDLADCIISRNLLESYLGSALGVKHTFQVYQHPDLGGQIIGDGVSGANEEKVLGSEIEYAPQYNDSLIIYEYDVAYTNQPHDEQNTIRWRVKADDEVINTGLESNDGWHNGRIKITGYLNGVHSGPIILNAYAQRMSTDDRATFHQHLDALVLDGAVAPQAILKITEIKN